jgi:predicted nucleic acid-binding protein
MILLDANVLIYFLDETSDFHPYVLGKLQEIEDEQEQIVTSHHIIEEVLFILSKVQLDSKLNLAIDKISNIPGIILAEPSASIDFARRYALLSKKHKLGINDALILQLMLDANISHLYSYDNKLTESAHRLGLHTISTQ